ncbi:hypothetical protein VTJ83DRAFT_7361 [Remersonia thermophila]|uniref:C2H2-type domain-containing protein n=1 Tax=Remersonia thermophila TaxID=72144 RepID=A0ABR4D3C3_9PEZI
MTDYSYLARETLFSFDDPFSHLATDSAMIIIDPILQGPSPTPSNISWALPQQPTKESPFDLAVSTHTPSRPLLGSPIEPPSARPPLSPPADTESYYDNHPTTPPDTALLSPYQRPLPLDARTHAMQFTQMGPGYVNPVDVNPGLLLDCEADNENAGFYQTPEYVSYDALHSHGMDPSQGAVPGFISPAGSPEEAASRYPALPNDDDDAFRKRAHDSDSDGDSQPAKRQRTAVRAHGRPRSTHGEKAVSTSARRIRTRPAAFGANGRDLIASTGSGRGTSACTFCNKTGFSKTDLEAHIKKQHRRFNCVFDFAGCKATFSSKNEWKRHTMTQHLLLHYWVCTEGACASSSQPATTAASNPPCSGAPTPFQNAPNGSIFNRKDLFTQHLKRMHAPKEPKDASWQNADCAGDLDAHSGVSPWSARLKRLQEDCKHPRCSLPTYMLCPVRRCATGPFRGPDAWNQRMEHVAKQHMERSEDGRGVVFGGDDDPTLVDWASRPDVAIIERAPEGSGRRWALRTPLVRGPGGNVVVTAPVAGTGRREEEEDAEGEEDD